MMESNNYKYFINLLNKIYDEDAPGEIEWISLTEKVIEEINEKLFHLQNNEQRTGFLMNLFKRFFNDGKDYNFYQIHLLEDANGITAKYSFIYNCLLSLRSIVYEISEETLNYGIDFREIMKNSIRTGGVPYYFLTFVFKESLDTIDLPDGQKEFTLPYNPHIFNCEQGQKIFDEWHEMHKEKCSHADYSFIFRMLESDGFLNVGETKFRDFLDDKNIVLGKLKTFNGCKTDKKIKLYNKIKSA